MKEQGNRKLAVLHCRDAEKSSVSAKKSANRFGSLLFH